MPARAEQTHKWMEKDEEILLQVESVRQPRWPCEHM
jgi:hypothetical protein